MFTGTYTALITPFTRRGEIDEKSLRALVDAQIQSGVSGLVPVGTTGESPTLSHAEHTEVIRIVVDQAASRVPVIAGTGSNNTAEAVELTAAAAKLGVSASLQVAPYYNKPSQDGLYAHFTHIAEQVDLPMIVYNIPGRTGKNIETETLLALAKHKNIIGLKDASGSLAYAMHMLLHARDFCVLGGDDNLALALIAVGGHGVISVASNILPREVSAFIQEALTGNIVGARKKFYALLPLMEALLSTESNPAAVKYLASSIGLCEEVYRLPLHPLREAQKRELDRIYRTSCL